MMTLFSTSSHQEWKKRVLAHAAFSAFYSLISWSVALSSLLFYYYKHGYRKDDGHGRNCHRQTECCLGRRLQERMDRTDDDNRIARSDGGGGGFLCSEIRELLPAFVNKKKSFYQQIKTTDCWRNKHKLQGIEINAKSAAQWVCYLAYMLWTMMCLVLFIRTGQTISFCTIAHNWF